MGGAAMGMQAAGGVMGTYGSYENGMAQSDYYKYLASQNRTQAGLVQQQADQQSNIDEDQGAFELKMQTRKTQEIEGAQTAAEGANGTAGGATSADIASDTFDKAKLDQMAIKHNADMKVWQTQNQAKLQEWNLQNEASGNEAAAKEAKRAGKVGAVTSLIGGAGQTANTWGKNKPYVSTT